MEDATHVERGLRLGGRRNRVMDDGRDAVIARGLPTGQARRILRALRRELHAEQRLTRKRLRRQLAAGRRRARERGRRAGPQRHRGRS